MVARGVYALLLLVMGLSLLVGGARLIWLGGSLYYAFAGILILACASFVWRRDWRAAWLYGAMLVGTLTWAIAEAGFQGWALAGRLVVPAIVGVPLMFRSVRGTRAAQGRRSSGWKVLIAGMLGAIVVGIAAHAIGPADYPNPLYQMGTTHGRGSAAHSPISDPGDWLNYGNDLAGSRFSGLDQINPGNVGNLTVAWEVHVDAAAGGQPSPSLETTPIKAGDSLYVCTAFNDVISIDVDSGHINWRFKSGISREGRAVVNCRGVAFFQVPHQTGLCARRVITNTVDARLIALDAATGALCPGFGVGGQTDLNDGMGSPDIGYYYVSSAPTILRGKIVLGGWVSDGQQWGEPSGVIRAYDAVTGKFAWAFDVGRPGEHGEPAPGQTYTHSTPNSWAPMSADPELGLVYAPTGNPAVDYYGGRRRPFDDEYSSAVVALDVETGAARWIFQTTHHDLWDYDVASQPTLVDIPTGDGVQRALVQPTKRGEIFLLDRATGRPLAEVQERPVPQGSVPGERYAPTQPFSVGMPSLGGPRYRERDMWGLTPLDQLWCRIKFRQARYQGTMTPPGVTPWIADPGILGGVEWGSASVDRDRALLIVNSNRVSNYNVLIPRAVADAQGIHPSVNGGPRIINGVFPQAGTPYAAKIEPFLSPINVPCNAPPFGRITAIDLRTHKLLWSKPLGTARDSGPAGFPSMLPFALGTPNIGGSLITRGGLVFVAAAQELALRALDVTSGKQLWSARLPAGGQATPMTYWSDRSERQFVVIAAGGRKGLQTKQGDSIIAYALPR